MCVGTGVPVRYADDLMCKSRQPTEHALARLRLLLADLGREPNEAKTSDRAPGGGRGRRVFKFQRGVGGLRGLVASAC